LKARERGGRIGGGEGAYGEVGGRRRGNLGGREGGRSAGASDSARRGGGAEREKEVGKGK